MEDEPPTVMNVPSIHREAKAPEKRALTTVENPSSNNGAVAVVIEKPSFLKLNKEGKATSTTTSCHMENESAL